MQNAVNLKEYRMTPLQFEQIIELEFPKKFLIAIGAADAEITAEDGYTEYIFAFDISRDGVMCEVVYNSQTKTWELYASNQVKDIRRFLKDPRDIRKYMIGLLDVLGIDIKYMQELDKKIKEEVH